VPMSTLAQTRTKISTPLVPSGTSSTAIKINMTTIKEIHLLISHDKKYLSFVYSIILNLN
jgi:hypothetical protein